MCRCCRPPRTLARLSRRNRRGRSVDSPLNVVTSFRPSAAPPPMWGYTTVSQVRRAPPNLTRRIRSPNPLSCSAGARSVRTQRLRRVPAFEKAQDERSEFLCAVFRPSPPVVRTRLWVPEIERSGTGNLGHPHEDQGAPHLWSAGARRADKGGRAARVRRDFAAGELSPSGYRA